MKVFSDKLYDELQEALKEISVDQDKSPIKRAKDSVIAVRTAISELKEFIISYKFNNAAEEIHFFKEIQPQYYRLLIYYIRVVSIETRCPVGGKEGQRIFFESELHQIQGFFEQNQDIYKYYRLEETGLDTEYFMRDKAISNLPTEDAFLLYDNRFCTEMGYKIAKIKANELLKSFLEGKLEELVAGRRAMTSPLKWTDKKIYLAELIYLLHANGVFGHLKIKTIVDAISNTWNCPIPNIYKMLEEMRVRKREKFPFIRQLLSSGERQMDEDDLKASK